MVNWPDHGFYSRGNRRFKCLMKYQQEWSALLEGKGSGQCYAISSQRAPQRTMDKVWRSDREGGGARCSSECLFSVITEEEASRENSEGFLLRV